MTAPEANRAVAERPPRSARQTREERAPISSLHLPGLSVLSPHSLMQIILSVGDDASLARIAERPDIGVEMLFHARLLASRPLLPCPARFFQHASCLRQAFSALSRRTQ